MNRHFFEVDKNKRPQTPVNDLKATGEAAARILVVEDEGVVALDLTSTLTDLGYLVVGCVASGETAIEKAIMLKPDLVLMDIRLSGKMDGIEAAKGITSRFDIPIIYLTAHSDDQTLRRALSTSTFGYLVKPFRAPELRCAIEIARHKHRVSQLAQMKQ